MRVTADRRYAGVLVPVFAVRTADDLGIGDTAGVRALLRWCRAHDLQILQTLPILELSDDFSPYNAISAQAIEFSTLTLRPDTLPDLLPEQFDAVVRSAEVAELRRGPVRYEPVRRLKRRLLEAAFATFVQRHWKRDTERARAFQAFLTAEAAWLPDYTLFRVLMDENDGSPAWEYWPREHQTPEAARGWWETLPEARRAALDQRRLFYSYVQWIAHQQWAEVRQEAERLGVALMGDMPYGIARASVDVWAHRSLFDLEWCGGAPPEWTFRGDPFIEKWGQNWGIPNYAWEAHRREGFAWWRRRVGSLARVFHLYRIDHVLGFFRIYSFPWTPDRNDEFLGLSPEEAALRTGGRLPGFRPYPDDTPEHRAANQKQGEEILRMLQAASGPTGIVAEDLGWVPDYVPVTLARLGIPGFRIPMFCREPDGRYTDPRRYPRLSLVQPATHDHPPLAARWIELWMAADAGDAGARRELDFLMEFAGLPGQPPPRAFTPKVHEGLLRAVFHASSYLAIVLLTDVLGLTDRYNWPGTQFEENWTARLPWTVEQLATEPAPAAQGKLLQRLVHESGRAPATDHA
ncbi:4-alpha-glucanotransferase [Limisphaera sp. VF-2]|uniref:4-alpha-glucanotransferase n=1 Tax=Limisphaera sp. VF-2 TaxID=3400418 RepID=UPI00176703F0|nr:4-alpha-glucanotransferase [Limisphaera sp.]